MNIKPLGDRVLVKVLKTEEMTASGIVLPSSAQKEKEQGEVVAIGSGEKVAKLGLKTGATVLFGKYSGDDVTESKVDYKILKEEDVLAVME